MNEGTVVEHLFAVTQKNLDAKATTHHKKKNGATNKKGNNTTRKWRSIDHWKLIE